MESRNIDDEILPRDIWQHHIAKLLSKRDLHVLRFVSKWLNEGIRLNNLYDKASAPWPFKNYKKSKHRPISDFYYDLHILKAFDNGDIFFLEGINRNLFYVDAKQTKTIKIDIELVSEVAPLTADQYVIRHNMGISLWDATKNLVSDLHQEILIKKILVISNEKLIYCDKNDCLHLLSIKTQNSFQLFSVKNPDLQICFYQDKITLLQDDKILFLTAEGTYLSKLPLNDIARKIALTCLHSSLSRLSKHLPDLDNIPTLKSSSLKLDLETLPGYALITQNEKKFLFHLASQQACYLGETKDITRIGKLTNNTLFLVKENSHTGHFEIYQGWDDTHFCFEHVSVIPYSEKTHTISNTFHDDQLLLNPSFGENLIKMIHFNFRTNQYKTISLKADDLSFASLFKNYNYGSFSIRPLNEYFSLGYCHCAPSYRLHKLPLSIWNNETGELVFTFTSSIDDINQALLPDGNIALIDTKKQNMSLLQFGLFTNFDPTPSDTSPKPPGLSM